MRISVSAGTPRVSLSHIMITDGLDGIFRRLSKTGVDGVDLFLWNIDEAHGPRLAQLSADYGIDIALISPFGSMIKAGISMSSVDNRVVEEFFRHARNHLELAARINAIVPVGYSRGRRDTVGAQANKDYDKRLMEALKRYDGMAQEFGVRLAIEPINRYEMDSVNTVSEAASLIRRGNLASTGILADLFHMNIEEVTIVEALRAAADLLTHVHFSDSNRHAPGAGHLDLLSAFRTLRAMEYHGYLGIEAIPGPSPENVITASVSYLRALEKVVPANHA